MVLMRPERNLEPPNWMMPRREDLSGADSVHAAPQPFRTFGG
jgi:hypothetical protein